MNDCENKKLTQSNYAGQMEMLGYDASGNPLDMVHVVRCRDCKHKPIDHRKEYNEMAGFGLEFPDDYCPCQCEDGWYNRFFGDDWFCANGEWKDMSTIDAALMRHGHIEIKVINPYDGEDCYCSECGHGSLLPDYKWCPYCGAKMDGEIE